MNDEKYLELFEVIERIADALEAIAQCSYTTNDDSETFFNIAGNIHGSIDTYEQN